MTQKLIAITPARTVPSKSTRLLSPSALACVPHDCTLHRPHGTVPHRSLIRYCKSTKDPLVSRQARTDLPQKERTTDRPPSSSSDLASLAVILLLCPAPARHRLPRPWRGTPQVPSVWGPLAKGEDPYAPPQTGCCSSGSSAVG